MGHTLKIVQNIKYVYIMSLIVMKMEMKKRSHRYRIWEILKFVLVIDFFINKNQGREAIGSPRSALNLKRDSGTGVSL